MPSAEPAVVKSKPAQAKVVAKPSGSVETNYAEFEKQAAAKLTPAQSSLLKRIGECESGFRMVPNKSGSSAFGIFQIMKVHDARAKRLGVSRMDPAGNISLAIDIFLDQGTTPWVASKSCWGK